MSDLDVLIVGAGTAGLSAMREVRKRTERFAIVDAGPWGTTCARVGCMPSKALIASANAFHGRRALADFGIAGAEDLELDVPAVLRRVRRLRDGFVAGVLRTTDSLGDRAVSGRARLVAPDTVEVDGRRLKTRRIVLATGSRPILPDAWRAFGDRVLTTDDLFEREDLPRRMAVVGLGPVGLELAQALCRLGLEVHAFDRSARLPVLEDPAVEAAARELLGREMPFHLGADVDLESRGDGIVVSAGAVEVTVDAVLVAVGRRPSLDGLGLESLGVTLDPSGRPPVDPHTLQVGDLPVFLAGDANGDRAILHEAADEGYVAGVNACTESPVRFARRVPLTVVFTGPNIARVGAPFDETHHLSGEVDFSRQGRARVEGRDAGLLRVYSARDSGRIVGAELCAPGGEHLAHLLALAITQGATVGDMLGMPFYHPVLEEGLRTALRALSRQLPGGGGPDLTRCEDPEEEALR